MCRRQPRTNPPDAKPEGQAPCRSAAKTTDLSDRGRDDADCRKVSRSFVNRVNFVGNTTTRDNVVRREIRLLEGGVFNTEAMKNERPEASTSSGISRTSRKGRTIPKVEKVGWRKEQGRRHVQVRGAEPEPAHLRRRRLAVRGLLRPARVPDVELPRPRRERDVLGAGRQARAELPGRVQRAVPVRPADHGRLRRCSSGSCATSTPTRRNRRATNVTFGFPRQGLHARLRDLQPRAGAGEGHQPVCNLARRRRSRNPFLADALLLGEQRQADHQPGDAEPHPQHGRQPDLPDPGPALHRDHGLGRARWQREVREADARRRLDLPAHVRGPASPCAGSGRTSSRTAIRFCRSTSGCSSAANTASAGSTSARSARVTRSRASSSAATRACWATPSTSSRCSVRCGSCCSTTPARCRDRRQNFD